MVHIKVVVSRIVGVQNHLLASLSSRVEQHINAQRKVIEEEVTSLRLHTTMSTR